MIRSQQARSPKRLGRRESSELSDNSCLSIGASRLAALVLLSITTSLFIGCDRAPRTAPVAKQPPVLKGNPSDTATDDPADSSEPAVVTDIDIPAPSGELLGKAISFTVRLGGDNFDGSGVIVHQTGDVIYVLTVAHAVAEGVINRVELFSLTSSPKPVATLTDISLVSAKQEADLALIQAHLNEDIDITVARLAEENVQDPKFGYSVGCGGGRPPRVLREQINRAGEFSIKLHGFVAKRFMWQTRRPQEVGRSGGPLLDAKGCLLGIALGADGGNGYYSHIREISQYLIDSQLVPLVPCAELLSIPQSK